MMVIQANDLVYPNFIGSRNLYPNDGVPLIYIRIKIQKKDINKYIEPFFTGKRNI